MLSLGITDTEYAYFSYCMPRTLAIRIVEIGSLFYLEMEQDASGTVCRHIQSLLNIPENAQLPCSSDLTSLGANTGAMVPVANIRGTPRAKRRLQTTCRVEPRIYVFGPLAV